MKRNTCMLMAVLCLLGSANAQTKASAFDLNDLSVKWELVQNNYLKQPQFLSALTLTNSGQQPFPAQGWALYFSYVQDIRPIPPTGNVTIEHVNGDIFRIAPKPGFTGITAGGSVRIEFVSSDQALNVSDAPRGYYVVWADQPGTGTLLSHISVAPIADTIGGISTPTRLYDQNWYTHDIPAAELPKIFPTPAHYRETGGLCQLTPANTGIIADSAFSREADYLSDKLTGFWGKKPPIEISNREDGKTENQSAENRVGKKRTIVLKWTPGPASGTITSGGISSGTLTSGGKPEHYELIVTPDGVTINASDPAGVFYGIQSLLSLVPPAAWAQRQTSLDIPTVEVADEPRFGFRSILIDIARNFQSKKEILKVLDLMALYKLNALHLHFSDDEGWRIAMPSFPELTQVSARRGHTLDSLSMLPASYGGGPDPAHSSGTGYYSREDFIGILRYAKARHIMVIPEVESPGHARAAIKAMDARYERLKQKGQLEEARRYLLRDTNDRSKYSSAQLWTDNVMCPALPSTYRFLDQVITDLVSMYAQADAPLSTIHFGGDEVPTGVWERSPACLAMIGKEPGITSINDLWYYYFGKISAMLNSHGLFISGWEEMAMRKTMLDGSKQLIPNPGFAAQHFRVHVWNNLIGSGTEDLPYRLANAGYEVVLSCANNLYFDFAYNKSPAEGGYYWGGYTDVDKPFYFIPYDYYKNSRENPAGNPIDATTAFIGKDRLTEYGKSNIVGIQGLLWAENVTTPERLEYMLIPKFLGLAERAWAQDPAWAREKDPIRSRELYDRAWSQFANVAGKRELPRLDYYAGGYAYRIPQPGLIAEDGKIKANIQLPGLALRYTLNGTEPTERSPLYTEPITSPDHGNIIMKAFDGRGRSGMPAVLIIP